MSIYVWAQTISRVYIYSFLDFFHHRLLQDIAYSSLSSSVGPCWLCSVAQSCLTVTPWTVARQTHLSMESSQLRDLIRVSCVSCIGKWTLDL